MTANTNLIHAIADALIEAHGQDATEWVECGGRAAVERGLAGWRAAIAHGAWVDRPEDTRRSWRRSRVAFRDQRMEDESGMREACLTAAPDGLRRLPFARAGAYPAHGRGR